MTAQETHETPPTKRVAGYIRVSTDEQARKGFGLDFQRKYIEQCIATNAHQGWILQEMYEDDGYSGAVDSRPAFKRMLHDAKARKIDIILVWRIDRLYRSFLALLETVRDIGSWDVDFKSVTEAFDSTSSGKFMFHLFGALAELERDIIRSRTSEGKTFAVDAGYYVGTNEPYGYTVEGEKKRRKLVILESEAKWVRKMFHWFVHDNWSAEKIAAELMRRKVPCKKDGKMTRKGVSHRRKNPPGFWHAETVRKMLRTTNYIGWYYFRAFTKDKHGERVAVPEDKRSKGQCPVIIPEALFKQAARRFALSKEQSNRAKIPYLLSGKIKCGECGSTYVGYTSMKGTKNYRCSHKNPTKTAHRCHSKEISEKQIAADVWVIVEKCLKKPEFVLNELLRQMREESMYNDLIEERKRVEAEMEQLTKARADLRDFLINGQMTKDEVQEGLNRIKGRMEDLTDEHKAVIEQLLLETEKEERILSLKELRKKYDPNLKKPTYEDKRIVLQAIVRRITLHGADVQLKLNVPKKLEDELLDSENCDGGPDRN